MPEIQDITAHPVREPRSQRAYTILKVTTRSGPTGYGECRAISANDLAELRRTIVGKEATAYQVIRRDMKALGAVQGAVNMALLDIVGQITKAPVYQVLGGPTRNKARALAPLHGDSDSALASDLKRARDAGFRAVIVPVRAPAARNQGQAFVHAIRRRMEALRDAGGNDMDFVLDGAGSLSPGDAASLAAALERFHLLWFDEPCPVSSMHVIRKISQETVTPLGFGRDVHQPGDFQDLLREEVIDVLRPDISANGISQIRQMSALAETYYTAVAPHHDGGPVATAAALHLAASLPNFFIQQIPFPEAEEDRRFRASLTTRPVEVVRDGFAELPAGPGLGITINEGALRI